LGKRLPGSRLMFLVYWHNILPQSSEVWDEALPRLTAESFQKQISWISRHFQPLDLSDFLNRTDPPDSSKRELVITFDDGFRGVYEFGLPILQEAGWTGGVFLLDRSIHPGDESPLMHAETLEIAFRITRKSRFSELSLQTDTDKLFAYLSTKKKMRGMKPEERTAFCATVAQTLEVLPEEISAFAKKNPSTYAKLTDEDCKDLYQKGWTLGTHTTNHPHLTQLPPNRRMLEIGKGHRCLEKRNRKTFAYPYGDYSKGIAEEVRALGFDAAFTTEPRLVSEGDNRYLLPRMSFGSLWTRAMKRYRTGSFKN